MLLILQIPRASLRSLKSPCGAELRSTQTTDAGGRCKPLHGLKSSASTLFKLIQGASPLSSSSTMSKVTGNGKAGG